MDKVALFSTDELRDLFTETASRKQVKPAIIEKDFWVTWVLSKIFNDTNLASILMFKGGTSLSKVFNVIERFSEDIDLILDWNLVTKEDPLLACSKNHRSKIRQTMEDEAQEFIISNLLPILIKLLNPICTCTIGKNKGEIHIMYPAVFVDQYLRPQIVLEIGPTAAWSPHETYEITSFAAEYFPQLFINPTCNVNAIVAKRTFWEKACILHEVAQSPTDNELKTRYSRHYYDLAMLCSTSIKDVAIEDISLLQTVINFRQQWYPRSWAKYEEIMDGKLRLLPDGYRMQELSGDYHEMRNMIFGDYPKFEEIIATLSRLEREINAAISHASGASNHKEMTMFSINGYFGNINQSTGNVDIVLPKNTNLSHLIPVYTITGSMVTVNAKAQISGHSTQNFESDVNYVVYAYNNTHKVYVATVTLADM